VENPRTELVFFHTDSQWLTLAMSTGDFSIALIRPRLRHCVF
jgi:hypothetical protein